jgi:hypothetical protein
MESACGSGVLAWLERADARQLRRIACATVGLVLLWSISHGHFAGSGDPIHYMMIAHSLVFDRDLDLGKDYTDPDNLVVGAGLDPGGHVRAGRGGVTRPVHDVGLPALAAPYFAVAYVVAEHLTGLLPEGLRQRARLDRWIALRQLVSVGMILVTCWLVAVFFDVSLRLTGQKALVFLWTLIWALSPPVVSHAYAFFTEIPSALLALLAYRTLGVGDEACRPRRALVAGLMVGLLPLVHARNIGLALGLGVVAVCRMRSHRMQTILFCLGSGAVLSLRLALNLYLWGEPLATPHARLGAWPGWASCAQEVTTRVVGLTLDPGHGLLPWAPIYLLVPAGLLWLRGTARHATREILLVFGSYIGFVLLPMTNVHGWRGGWSPAARFLVPVVPLLALGVPAALAWARARRVALVLCATQLVIDVLCWSRPMLQWTDFDRPAPMLRFLLGDALAAAVPRVTSFGAALCLAGATLVGLGAALTAYLAPRRAPAR